MRLRRKRHLRHGRVQDRHRQDQPLVVLLVTGDQTDANVLAQQVRQRGNYERVEIARAHPSQADLPEVVNTAASQGTTQVIIVPISPIYGGRDGTHRDQTTLDHALEQLRAQFPQVEMALADPLLDLDGYADLILHQVHLHDRSQRLDRALEITLASLAGGASGRVRDLHGGQDFLARMAALGFTPGAEVTMVQNFGHGPVIVAVRGTRIALGRGEAGKVHIWKET
jgi:ferrous iron transport protein A